MKRVYLMSEGQTEETFVRELLYPYLLDRGICSVPILFRTSRDAKGGIVSYGKETVKVFAAGRGAGKLPVKFDSMGHQSWRDVTNKV